MLCSFAGAATATEPSPEDSFAEPYAAVVDQTLTFTGHEFASRFTAKWAELGGVQRSETLAIRERPTGSRGSLVWIEYRMRPIFSGFFSPNRNRLKENAEMAAQQALSIVGETELARLLFKDPDVAGDEF
jgi:hypothetical protein